MTSYRELAAYIIAALGLIFGALAAFLSGGWVAALTALSAGCASLAAVLGYSSRSTQPTVTK
jgi:hypothetical protein